MARRDYIYKSFEHVISLFIVVVVVVVVVATCFFLPLHQHLQVNFFFFTLSLEAARKEEGIKNKGKET